MPTVSLNSPAISPSSPRATSPNSVRISTRARPGWTGTAAGSPSTSASPSRAVSSPRGAASPSSAVSPSVPSPASAYATAASASTSAAGSPVARTSSTGAGLLVPTDRAAEDLEENWLPRLGRLRVAGEVRVPGYALFGIRSWYLSRTHWSFTIATLTGKPTDQISCYVLVPAPELSETAGAQELAVATRRLAGETQGQPRRTEFGTLLVSTPGGYRQEISPIQTGDMREAWPFIVLNTALRRLGCGGRAALGNEFPVPAVRRKFYELYRITMPKGEADSVGGASPPASPVSGKAFDFMGLGHGHPSEQPSAEIVASSSILLNAVELVKIIQAALAIWGMYGPGSDDTEVDGLFCDETKTGLFEWRRMMGMESDDGFKLAKETSGGCIDPRTLAALVSSITSVRYQLAVLGVEKVPKDPFSSPRKFIAVWRTYMAATDPKNTSQFLSISGIRALNSCYISGRSKSHPTDALKVHRFLLSGVASATSSISANLKGSGADDSSTPLRKLEQHKRFGGDADDSGIGMIVPYGNGNVVAAPDVITTDLDAYRKLIEKSREREWDTMGARRVAELWSGVTAERGPERDGARHHGRLAAFRRRVTQNTGDDEDGAGAMGTFKGMRDRTGAAIKGGFGLVGRRHATGSGANYDTSDSEGPSRSRRKQNQSVPVVVEPEDDGGDRDRLAISQSHLSHSRSPSPTPFRDGMPQTPTLRPQARSTHPAIQSPLQHSMRLSSYSGEFSDGSISRAPTTSPFDRRRSFTHSAASHDWAAILPPTSPHMLRTRSDPPGSEKAWDVPPPIRRSKSFTHANEYRDLRRRTTAPLDQQVHQLIIDVDMCGLVWELRERERALAKRAADMQTLERSALAASQAIFDARDTRLAQLTNLEREAATLVDEIHTAGATGVEDDVNLHRAANNVQFYLSEDTNTNELVWALQDLQKAWEGIRDEPRAEPAEPPPPRPWWQW